MSGDYDFGEILDNVAKLSPKEGDIIVISGVGQDDIQLGRGVSGGFLGVRVLLTAEGEDVYLLHPQPGDTLLLRSDALDEETLATFTARLHRHFPDLPVQVVPADTILELADEEMMRRLGWVRAPQPGRLPERPKPKPLTWDS